jgi:hypothetical protein
MAKRYRVRRPADFSLHGGVGDKPHVRVATAPDQSGDMQLERASFEDFPDIPIVELDGKRLRDVALVVKISAVDEAGYSTVEVEDRVIDDTNTPLF